MTKDRLHIIKTILAVLLILALPSMFFQYIGDQPLKTKGNAAKSIAIVNEDQDISDEITQGNEMVKQLVNNPEDFHLEAAVSSGEAENGLKNGKYDAVMTIPSDFSRNIYSYSQDQPVKAKITYKVQDQLTAVNKEKVMRELQRLKDQMNTAVTAMYWDHVSQRVDVLKKDFNKVLDKEIKFKNAMYSFYQPGSKDLAGEIDQQRQLLAQLQTTMADASKQSPERAAAAAEVNKNLASFITAVENYKTYQDQQKLTLTNIQAESEKSIAEGTSRIASLQALTQQQVSGKADELAAGGDGILGMLNQNTAAMADLSVVRKEQAERQKKDIDNLQGSLIDSYKDLSQSISLESLQKQILPLREKLAQPPAAEDPGTGSTEPDGENPGTAAENSQKVITASRQNTLAEEGGQASDNKKPLDAILEKLTGITELIKETDSEQNSELLQKLNELSNDVRSAADAAGPSGDINWEEEYQKLSAEYENIAAANKELLAKNDELQKLNDELQKKLQQQPMSPSGVIDPIKSMENDILKESALPPLQKEELQKAFSKELQEHPPEELLRYHTILSQYKGMLDERIKSDDPAKSAVLENPDYSSKLTSILEVNSDEANMWDSLKQELDASSSKMQELNGSMQDFIQQYNANVQGEQTYIGQELASIQNSAAKLSGQLQQPDAAAAEDIGGSTIVLTANQQIGQELTSMDQLIQSLSDRQDNIVGYTSGLQEKVVSVQDEANSLNEKWAANVQTTQNMKKRAQGILANTLIDGQKNGYVYDYLANPLTASATAAGTAPAEESKAVPPVVILVIILISSLLIGYFSHYFKAAPLLIRASLFGLLNLITGLMIGLFGLNIYQLTDDRAIQWTIFTILLLLVSSMLIRTAFVLGSFIGWVAAAGLILFYVSPLLAMALPNFDYSDPMSAVYLSIQNDPATLFGQAVWILAAIAVILGAIPFAVKAIANRQSHDEGEAMHEA